jgi:cell division control protein 45
VDREAAKRRAKEREERVKAREEARRARERVREEKREARRRLREERGEEENDEDDEEEETESEESDEESEDGEEEEEDATRQRGYGLNRFGTAFQDVVSETNARVRIDSFEHCVVEVKKEDLGGFLESLSMKAVVG